MKIVCVNCGKIRYITLTEKLKKGLAKEGEAVFDKEIRSKCCKNPNYQIEKVKRDLDNCDICGRRVSRNQLICCAECNVRLCRDCHISTHFKCVGCGIIIHSELETFTYRRNTYCRECFELKKKGLL